MLNEVKKVLIKKYLINYRLFKYYLLCKSYFKNTKYVHMKDIYSEKIFCIGMNKTGTTSMKKALMDLGCHVGNQREAEILTLATLRGNYSFLFNYCKTAEAFQDVPFSCPNVYKMLDKQFPNAKFILTVRDNDEEWYGSLIRFNSKRLLKYGPSVKIRNMKKSIYCFKGWEYELAALTFLKDRQYVDDDFAYDEKVCKEYYNKHNAEVTDYFKGNKNFLMLNLKGIDSYQKLCDFLKKKPLYQKFPHEKSSR